MLTAASIMVTRDERLRLVDGYNLEIADLEPQDAGDYVCQISDKVNKDQIHTVEILGKHPLLSSAVASHLAVVVVVIERGTNNNAARFFVVRSAAKYKGRAHQWTNDSTEGGLCHARVQGFR